MHAMGDAKATSRKGPKGGIGRKSQARTVDAVEWQRRAVELRTQGWTYQRIADECGVSVSAAYQAVVRYLEETRAISREAAEEVRRLELDRLDRMLAVIGPKAEDGDLAAADRVLRIQERRASLLGIDAPKASAVTVDARPDTVKALMALALVTKS